MAFTSSIALVRLQPSDRFNEETLVKMNKLVAKHQAYLVTETQAFRTLLEHNKPKVIVLADNAIAIPNNDDLRALLYDHIKAGGTIILAFKFAVSCQQSDLDNMFKDMGMPSWTHADSSLYYHTRTNLIANPAMYNAVFPPATYHKIRHSYPIKAVHIEGVEDRDKIYYHETEDYGSIAAIPGHDSACPSAFTKIGAGYLGYVGDFPLLIGTVRLIEAMIGKSSAYKLCLFHDLADPP